MKAILTAALILTAAPALAQDLRGDANSPKLYAPDGRFLGNYNNNSLDPNSIANPLGKYGSPLAPNGVNNPLSPYGSRLSPNYSNPYGNGLYGR